MANIEKIPSIGDGNSASGANLREQIKRYETKEPDKIDVIRRGLNYLAHQTNMESKEYEQNNRNIK